MMAIADEIKERLGSIVTNWNEHSANRVYLAIKPADIRRAVTVLFKDLGLRFIIATAQDTPHGIEILYHFSFDKTGQIFSVRVVIEDKKHPEIDSLAPLFPGAEWIEREMWEMVGVNFKGHPNLKRLLLNEEWPEGKHPLRHKED